MMRKGGLVLREMKTKTDSAPGTGEILRTKHPRFTIKYLGEFM